MARIPTVEITVNGKRKIVNADDARAKNGLQQKEETQEIKPKRGRPRKGN